MNHIESYYINDRSEVAALLPTRHSKVLEIGCGEGNFTKNLPHFEEYWGIEPVSQAAERARHHVTRLLIGSYDKVCQSLPDHYFDLIVCNDVIEHMTDHHKFLLSIKEKMSTDGILIGSIPNVRYVDVLYKLLVKKDWRYRDDGVLDYTHFRFFTEKSLRRSFEECGYIVEELRGINSAVIKARTAKRHAVNFILTAISLLTFRYYDDVQYRQFAFRVRTAD